MLQKNAKNLSEEYNSYSKAEKWFILCMMVCGFCITAEAAITRASANSIFLSAYTAKFFPVAWLVSVVLNFAIVPFFYRFLPRLGCVRMLCLSVMTALSINSFCALYLKSIHALPFFLYLWKDIFIILMFQQLWSVIHATINSSRAKYLYGIIFGMGGLGSVAGSFITSAFAVSLGSERLLLATIPFYFFTAAAYILAFKARDLIPEKQNITRMSVDSTDVLGGMKLIHKSKFLIFILSIVLSMQVTSTILDYQFSSYLEQAIVIQDLRTAFLGKFFGIVNTVNIALQFFGGYVLVRLLGLERSHLFIPIVLSLFAVGFIAFPTFPFICLYFAHIKAFDYSLFGIIKEMLYIPLKVEEKFKAKAIIDVFVYRTAKACASLIILALSSLSLLSLNTLLSYAVFFIFLFWMMAVLFLFKYYHKEAANHSLNWSESRE